MLVTLTVIRYPARFVPMAVLSMALFRLPLYLHKRISFYKLMGTGRNGTFDKRPEWTQWAILAVHDQDVQVVQSPEFRYNLHGDFIKKWLRFFRCETYCMALEPEEGHGFWDGKQPFGALERKVDGDGPVAVLTRATIRLGKLKRFWGHVDAVARQMAGAPGFITSIGVGEVPYIKQATFSVWESREQMKAFAYQLHEHREVVKKTRQEKWYSEDLFVRFKLLGHWGSLQGKQPLDGIG